MMEKGAERAAAAARWRRRAPHPPSPLHLEQVGGHRRVPGEPGQHLERVLGGGGRHGGGTSAVRPMHHKPLPTLRREMKALALTALLAAAAASAAAADPGAAALGAAIRNATSDWDELASILAEWLARSAGVDAQADLIAFLAVKAVRWVGGVGGSWRRALARWARSRVRAAARRRLGPEPAMAVDDDAPVGRGTRGSGRRAWPRPRLPPAHARRRTARPPSLSAAPTAAWSASWTGSSGSTEPRGRLW